MAEKWVVRLTVEERKQLERLVAPGKSAAATIVHARILLKTDESPTGDCWTDEEIVEGFDTSLSTIRLVRKEFVGQGLESALSRKRPTGRRYRKLDGAGEAHLIALACSSPPKGRVRWTMQLLADKLVELKIVDSISDDAVHRTLKKTNLNRG